MLFLDVTVVKFDMACKGVEQCIYLQSCQAPVGSGETLHFSIRLEHPHTRNTKVSRCYLHPASGKIYFREDLAARRGCAVPPTCIP